jgi:hypothetical protein
MTVSSLWPGDLDVPVSCEDSRMGPKVPQLAFDELLSDEPQHWQQSSPDQVKQYRKAVRLCSKLNIYNRYL